MNVDDIDFDAINHTLHEFYSMKENPILDKLLHSVKEKGLFTD